MPPYQVEFTRAADKQIRKLDGQIHVRIVAAIERLADDPRPPGHRQLTGHPGFRVRVGDWRVIYTVDESARVVIVQGVGHRREIYR